MEKIIPLLYNLYNNTLLMRKKTVAISLINYNSYENVVRLSNLLPASICDIFILDNASANNEWVHLKALYHDVEHIFVHSNTTNRWFSWGNNDNFNTIRQIGVYQYLLLLNPDVELENGFLEQFLQAAAEDQTASIRGPEIVTMLAGKKIKQYGGITNMWVTNCYPNCYKNNSYSFVSWCCFLITRSAAQSLNLLDERYFLYREEVDLCFRGIRQWHSLRIIPQCTIIHHQDYIANNTTHFLYHRNRSRILFSKQRANRYQWPTIIIRTILLLIYFTIKTGCHRTYHVLWGIYHGFTNDIKPVT